MDPSLCRDHLTRLLSEEAGALRDLEAVLEKEHEFITSNNIEALETTGSDRDACVGVLLRIDAERLSLCRSTGRAADKVGLLSLISWCDRSGALQAHWRTNAANISHTRNLNDRNGALVNNRLKRVEVMLDALNGNHARESKVYSSRGSAYQQTQAGRVCHIQA